MCRIFLLLIPVFIFGTSPLRSTPAFQQKELRILVTSDLHGWLSTTLLTPHRTPKGILHITPLIQSRRTKDTLLLDGGDLISGSPYSYFHNFYTATPTANNLFFSNLVRLKYDAIAVGNHDLEIFPILDKFYRPKANFKWISANILRDGSPYFPPYAIFNKGGLKIAVIGLTTAYTKMWVSPEVIKELTITSSLKSLKRELKLIRKKEKPDLLIGLFHLSTNPYRDDQAGKINRIPNEENIETILQETDDLDLVISGHDHRLSPYNDKNHIIYIHQTPIIRGGHWGGSVIELNLKLRPSHKAYNIAEIQHNVWRPKKSDVLSKYYRKNVGKKYRTFILKKLPLDVRKHTLAQADQCINILNGLANTLSGTEGSFLPKAKIRKKISKSGIFRKDILNWFPYLNKGVQVSLSKRDIKRLLDRRGDKKGAFKNIFFRFLGEEVHTFNQLKRGNLLKDDRHYQILISDYHFQGGKGWFNRIFPRRNKKTRARTTAKFLKENLEAYLFQKRPLPDACSFLSYFN